MLIWLVSVAALALIWAAMWKNLTGMAVGILIGLPIGWLFARSVTPLLTADMHEIPIWLPPLPIATVAILLIVVGLITFLRGDDDESSSTDNSSDSEH